MELQELSAEIAALQGDLATAAAEYRRVLDMRREDLRSGLPPEQLFEKWFYEQNVNLDGLTEPGPFCAYVETQLRLADVLRRAGRPYEAEDVLGECRTVTTVVVAERPNALRYRIAEANVWALAAELIAETRPADAEILFRRARQIWTEAARRFPHAKEYVSGVHGLQPDWDRFEAIGRLFPHLPAAHTDDEKLDTSKTIWALHTAGRAKTRLAQWEEAIGDFEKSAALRTKDHAYDWLQLAIAHAKLGQHEKAQEWLQKAEESISQMPEPHIELIEMRDEARAHVEHTQPET